MRGTSNCSADRTRGTREVGTAKVKHLDEPLFNERPLEESDMSFEEFLDKEIEKEQGNQDRFKSEWDAVKAKEQEEQNRTHAQHLSFKQLVEETHNLFRP